MEASVFLFGPGPYRYIVAVSIRAGISAMMPITTIVTPASVRSPRLACQAVSREAELPASSNTGAVPAQKAAMTNAPPAGPPDVPASATEE